MGTSDRGRRRSFAARRILLAALATSIGLAGWTESRDAASPASSAPPRVIASARGPAPVVTSPPVRPRRSATPRPDPCTASHQPQLVVVSIEQQHLWACSGHRTALSTPVTTGAARRPGEATPRGTFAVQGLNRNTTLTTSAAGRYPVRYWIPFKLGVWGFHDAPWQRIPFGSKRYVTRGSRGCVHMPLAAIRRLFHWVHLGTPVRIR